MTPEERCPECGCTVHGMDEVEGIVLQPDHGIWVVCIPCARHVPKRKLLQHIDNLMREWLSTPNARPEKCNHWRWDPHDIREEAYVKVLGRGAATLMLLMRPPL